MAKAPGSAFAATLWFTASALSFAAAVINYRADGEIKWFLLGTTIFTAAMGFSTLRGLKVRLIRWVSISLLLMLLTFSLGRRRGLAFDLRGLFAAPVFINAGVLSLFSRLNGLFARHDSSPRFKRPNHLSFYVCGSPARTAREEYSAWLRPASNSAAAPDAVPFAVMLGASLPSLAPAV
jgi:hypothetical protein